jgi:hypothetical protein
LSDQSESCTLRSTKRARFIHYFTRTPLRLLREHLWVGGGALTALEWKRVVALSESNNMQRERDCTIEGRFSTMSGQKSNKTGGDFKSHAAPGKFMALLAGGVDRSS